MVWNNSGTGIWNTVRLLRQVLVASKKKTRNIKCSKDIVLCTCYTSLTGINLLHLIGSVNLG